MAACYRLSNSSFISDTSNIDSACSLISTANLNSPCCPIKDTGSLCLSDQLCWWKDIPGPDGLIRSTSVLLLITL